MITEDFLKYKKRGTGVLIRSNDFFLFVIANEKYWTSTGDVWNITYTNTGGHVEPNESITEGSKREVLEELGCDLTLISSKRTIVCELENPIISVHEIQDEIGPTLIYNSNTLDMSVCVYLGEISEDPTPQMEVPALLFLPLAQIQGGELSSLLGAGARLVVQDGRKIPAKTILEPFGSANLLVRYWDDFLSLEGFRQFLETKT